MILTILTGAMYVAGGAAVAILLGVGLWLIAEGFRDRQRKIGYGYGVRDGMRDGYRKGRADAALAQVLAMPTETEHFAGVMSALGDSAQDGSLAFAEALLSGKLREPVGEDAQR